ncbi:MAG: glycosyltransferase family 2 protein [Acidobacteria bacterium]|nr:glycosyltransferase family 2 protein [Acidobacteriota bacterium]
MEPRIDISVVIINFRSAAFTRDCLRSLYAAPHARSFEIIVIDNASYDGCAEIIAELFPQEQFPQLRFLQSEHNLGFAGANNLGFSMSRGETVLFLNPDTEVRGAALDVLLAALESLPDAGMVGAHLLNSDLSVQTSSITAFPSILNQVLGTEYLRQKFPAAKLWGIQPLFEKHSAPVRVDAISGACMLARRSVLEKVRCFTTEYFMYAEDLDLCLKVKQAGGKIYYVPTAEIVHHGGQSSKSRTESNYAALMIRESMYQFMQRHRGTAYAMLFRMATAAVSLFRLVLLSALYPVAYFSARKESVMLAWKKWAAILGWCFGVNRWVGRERVAAREVLAPGRTS